MKLLKRRGVRQFVKFGLVGVSSTILDWGLYLLLTRYLLVFYLIAKALSFILGVTNSYTWNRKWTFRSKEPKKLHQFSKFLVVASVGLGLNTLIMYIVVSRLHLSDIIGLLLSSVFVMSWNFLVNKFWTFKEGMI